MPKLLFVIGTRPEIIKIAPIILQFREIGFSDYAIVNSGQHNELIKPYWKLFDLKADYNLEIISPGQRLGQLTAAGISKFDELIESFDEKNKPEYIIAQGDTTTVMVSAMVAFYHQIKFAHIEAGLRTNDLMHPFPEEYNRKVVSINANINFTPTARATQNLRQEGIEKSKIFQTGNTVVDAVNYFKGKQFLDNCEFKDHRLKKLIEEGKQLVLITCHRRENHESIQNIISAIEKLAEAYSELNFVWPLHANPKVKEPVESSGLTSSHNVLITDPLDYLELLGVMERSVKILTDSGGIQEEAPTFNIPVVVMREVTERQEAIEAGLSVLVGSDENKIIEAFNSFEIKPGTDNPFGDGHAAERIAQYLIGN